MNESTAEIARYPFGDHLTDQGSTCCFTILCLNAFNLHFCHTASPCPILHRRQPRPRPSPRRPCPQRCPGPRLRRRRRTGCLDATGKLCSLEAPVEEKDWFTASVPMCARNPFSLRNSLSDTDAAMIMQHGHR
jgi:hypothetical protein